MDFNDLPPTDFNELGLHKKVLQAIRNVGYETPTPIQALTIPPLLAGKDILGQAQTGTGKTAAFALPLLSRLDIRKKGPQVLVLTPTRELAIQVAEAFQRYALKINGFRVLAIYGGRGYDNQIRQLHRGLHVVVGTPGRLMDHLRRGTMSLEALDCLVIDEADEMLHMGFIEDVEWILKQTPGDRQIALFSATIPKQIKKIAKQYLQEPEEITVRVRTTTVDTLHQRFWMMKESQKTDALIRILESESFKGILIFVKTKVATVALSEKLEAQGYASEALNGDMAQKARERTIDHFKKGKLDILVATDVAARGLDVERISHVINYDIPNDTDAYVHRVGRTGRAGRSGEAILFVTPREKSMVRVIEKATRQKMKMMTLPSIEAINEKRISRFKQRITDTIATKELSFFHELIEQYQQENNVSGLDIAAALAKMAQGDHPLLLVKKHIKPEIVNPASPPRSRNAGTFNGKKNDHLEKGMERFRIEVGRLHGVKVGNIVGAIANETGLAGEHIGRIDIHDNYSIVDLPKGMPQDIYRMLKKVWLFNKKLRITRMDAPQKHPARKRVGM